MASAELSRRAQSVVAYPPLSELGDLQRREFHEALLDANSFEDLSGKWQAAILKAEQNRPKLRVKRDLVGSTRSPERTESARAQAQEPQLGLGQGRSGAQRALRSFDVQEAGSHCSAPSPLLPSDWR